MKKENSSEISKKIRNKLIYYTYLDLKKKPTEKNCLLINSMTPKELNNKYQKCSDYCVEKIETYTSSHLNNGIDNNNYFHVSVTYCSLNNNYHMLVDNNNVDQYIGQNNIVGKYYKGNTIQIRTTTDTIKYNICLNHNKLEKKVIGANKLIKPHRTIASSLDITKNIIIDNININNNNDDNYGNIKKLIKDNMNIEKVQTNCGNKIRKTNTQKMLNKYMLKLKKYCANLICLEVKHSTKNLNEKKTNKYLECFTPTNRKRKKNDKNFKSGKEKPKFDNNTPHFPQPKNQNHSNLNSKLSDNRNYPFNKKLKSQTKIIQNFKISMKNSYRKHKSIDKFEEESISPKKPSPKKAFSPKKNISPKKNSSPKKISSPKKTNNIIELNSGGIPTSKFFNVYPKNNKKEKANDAIIIKYVSGNKPDLPLNRRKANLVNNNGYSKLNNNNEKISSNNFKSTNNSNINEKTNPNNFRVNNFSNNITKKGKLKKSLTINKALKFRTGEILEKKLNTIRLKESSKH